MIKKSILVVSGKEGVGVEEVLRLTVSPWAWGGVLFYIINLVFFALALKNLEVSAAYPVLAGFGFALLTVAAGYLFGEDLSLYQWSGVALVLTGIFLLSQ